MTYRLQTFLTGLMDLLTAALLALAPVQANAASNPTAQFLTPHTAGSTPAQVIDNLALPSLNPATQLNAATINQPIGVLEGVIAPQPWGPGGTTLPGGGWQVFVPGGSQFWVKPPVTIGDQLQ